VPKKYAVRIVDVCDRSSKIRLNKAFGPHGIPNNILKQMANNLEPFLAATINCSSQQGTAPDVWKL
jgi:hypothetical protein